jgi:hypothetical protein
MSTAHPPDDDPEMFIGYNDPNTRGLLQDMEGPMTKLQGYNLTAHEVEIVYLSLARLHDLEDFGYRRDWEGIATYCPRFDEPDED